MNAKHLVAAALLVAIAGAAPAQTVRSGIERWQKADYSGAVAIWRPLAESGDADAAFNLGQAYRLGRGVPTNLSAAKTWFERAANKGHVDAQTTLGLLLFENNEQAEAVKRLKAAAEQGEPRALLIYGTALVNGDGVTQDPVLGYAYVSRSAAQGLAPAKETLGQLDRLLPLDVRKKGVAIALQKAKIGRADATKKSARAEKKPAQRAKVVSKEDPLAPRPTTPPPVPSRRVTAAAPATGNWRIQLGAFSQRASAEALYRRLGSKPALAGRSPIYIPVGRMTRLQVGPFASKAAANAACASIGTACFVVPAK